MLNPESIAGKIALIDRMECFFEVKVANAQAAGAIGAIICNFENAIINMADSDEELNVTIPSVMISSSACAPLRAADEGSVVAPEIAPHVADGRAQSLDLIPEPGIFALIAAAGFLLIIRRRDR